MLILFVYGRKPQQILFNHFSLLKRNLTVEVSRLSRQQSIQVSEQKQKMHLLKMNSNCNWPLWRLLLSQLGTNHALPHTSAYGLQGKTNHKLFHCVLEATFTAVFPAFHMELVKVPVPSKRNPGKEGRKGAGLNITFIKKHLDLGKGRAGVLHKHGFWICVEITV